MDIVSKSENDKFCILCGKRLQQGSYYPVKLRTLDINYQLNIAAILNFLELLTTFSFGPFGVLIGKINFTLSLRIELDIPKFTTNTHISYIEHLRLIMMINIRENKPTQTHPKSLNEIGNHNCWETGRSPKAPMSLSFMTNKSQTPHFKPKS